MRSLSQFTCSRYGEHVDNPKIDCLGGSFSSPGSSVSRVRGEEDDLWQVANAIGSQEHVNSFFSLFRNTQWCIGVLDGMLILCRDRSLIE